MRHPILATVAAASFALFVGAPRDADAQPSGPKADVTVLHGTPCPAKNIGPGVGEPPPVLFNCWVVKDHKTLALIQTTPGTMLLPNGRTFQVAYNGPTNEKAPRFKVATSISKPDGSAGLNPLADFTAEPGKDFHVGGFLYGGGMLFIRIRIVP